MGMYNTHDYRVVRFNLDTHARTERLKTDHLEICPTNARMAEESKTKVDSENILST